MFAVSGGLLQVMQTGRDFRTGDPSGRLFQVVLQLPRPRRVAQLAQRLRLDLPDPFPSYVELLAHFLERPGTAVLQPETELQHSPLAAGERVQDGLDLLLEELVRRRL